MLFSFFELYIDILTFSLKVIECKVIILFILLWLGLKGAVEYSFWWNYKLTLEGIWQINSCFCVLYWDRVTLCSTGCPWTTCKAQTVSLCRSDWPGTYNNPLASASKHWDCRCTSPCLALVFFLYLVFGNTIWYGMV